MEFELADGEVGDAEKKLVLLLLPLFDEKKDVELRLERNELALGNDIEGNALDRRFRASEPTDDDLPWRVPDWNTDDMALGLDDWVAGAGAGAGAGT